MILPPTFAALIRLGVCSILATASAAAAVAQEGVAGTPRSPAILIAGWPAALREEVSAILDSATRSGLPVAPLRAKIAEGIAKEAAPTEIVSVVRKMYSNLLTAQRALGPSLTESELAAAAAAVQSGVTPEQLRTLRASLPPGRSSTQVFVVLTDLVHRGVLADESVAVLSRLARAGAGDDALTRFRSDIARDVSTGVAVRAAMTRHASEYISRGFAPSGAIVPPPSGAVFPPPTPDDQASAHFTRDSSLVFSAGFRGWPTVNGPARAVMLGTHVRSESSWLRARLDANVASAEGSGSGRSTPYLLDGRFVLATDAIRVGKLGGDASAGAEYDASDPRATWMQRSGSVRGWYGEPTRGMWASAGALAPRDLHANPASIELQTGTWLTRGAIALSASVRHIETGRLARAIADSGASTDSTCRIDYDPGRALQQYQTACPKRLRTLDVAVGAAWTARSTRIHIFAAHRVLGEAESGAPRESWLGGNVDFGWSDDLRFTLEAERRPTDIVRGLPSAQRFGAGVRLSPALFRKQRPINVPGTVTLPASRPGTLALGEARVAEIRGDFTDWLPVRLTAGRDGVWLLPEGIAPGVHTLSVRLDGGAWHAPPGLPMMEDGFGGVVGVLVVS